MSSKLLVFFGLFFLAVVTPHGSVVYGQQLAVAELRVEGNSRLPAVGIIGASGLHAGSNIVKTDLDAAAQKLFETGLFTGINYRYDPSPGAPRPGAGSPAYIVTLLVTEDRARTGVVLDIPGYPEAQLWADLKRADSLIDTVIPDSDAATNYYSHAIEAVLAKANHAGSVVMRPEADLTTGRTVDVFQPAVLPKVGSVGFEGNQAIASDVLSKAIGHLTMGQDFTERSFSGVVRLNLTPLYEEKGLLTVKFPPLKLSESAGVANVTVPIEEGRAWNLGNVSVTGEGIPTDEMLKSAHFAEGKLANWKQVQAGVDAMEKVLKRQGYLGVSSKPARAYHEDTGVVDLAVAVAKGPQYFFGSLQVAGLDAGNQAAAMGAWKLKSGDPLDYYYVYADYSQSLKLAGPQKQIHIDLHPRAGTNTIDVVVAFR